MTNLFKTTVLVLVCSLILACESTYYSAMEGVGYHKREIMVDRIEDVADAQEDAQEQFKSALEQFNSVVAYDGGDLEELYDRLNAEYEDSVGAADDIRERIEAVANVSEALFDEWEEEISLYSSASLRKSSQSQLNQTRREYKNLMAAMQRSEATLKPVLDTFQDQVLYLKHNLNARAIASLKGELGTIDAEVQKLIKAMDVSIAEAKQFITTLQSE